MTTLAPGMVQIKTGSDEKRISCAAVLPKFRRRGLRSSRKEAMPAEELSAEKIAQKIKNAEEDVADADTDDKKLAAQQSLDRLKELEAAL